MKNEILNIIIVGTGGQGVFTLSNLIRKLAHSNGYDCEGATFKGGAQRMGTVYSEIRIRHKSNSSTVFSSQIQKGELDVLIGLEPWETLRFATYCNANTKVISNSVEEKLYVERMTEHKIEPVLKQLNDVFQDVILADFSADEEEKMNIKMLKTAIENKVLPFTFQQLIEVK